MKIFKRRIMTIQTRSCSKIAPSFYKICNILCFIDLKIVHFSRLLVENSY